MNKIEITVLSARVLDALSGRGLKAKTVHEFERYGTRRIVKHCLGKGQILLQSYFTENGITPQKSPDMPLFWSGNYRKLTRSGITYIVQKYAAAAQAISTDIPATISPHVFRHTKAMHLVQANVNTVYIKDYLGHADISTTEIYARADNEAKHAALEKASLCLELPCASNWEQDADLIAWLSSLG